MVNQEPGDGATKRKSTAEHGGGPEAKRLKLGELAFDGMVTVTATGNQWRPGAHSPHLGKPFTVYKQLLSHSSAYMKTQIDKQRRLKNVKIDLSETHWAHFEVYFTWIHKHFISSDVEARRFLIEHLRGVAGGSGKYSDRAVDELCSLLRMGKMLEDTAFTTDVVRMLEDSILKDSATQSLNLQRMKFLWSLRELGSPGNVERWVLGRKSIRLTREGIESQCSTMDSSLLEALRKAIPFATIAIRTGKGAGEQKITVDKKLATGRSNVLTNVLKAGNGDSPGRSDEKVTLDASGEILLNGDFEAGALDNWSQTLVKEGNELEDLLSHYPNIKTNQAQACDLKTALCGMAILAEALDDDKVQRMIIATLTDYRNDPTKCLPNSLQWKVTTMVAKAPRDSGLRRWVVDYVAYNIVGGKMSVDFHKAIPAGMLKEVFARMHEIYMPVPGCDGPQLADLDRYCKPI